MTTTKTTKDGASTNPHPVVTYGYVVHELQNRVGKNWAKGKGNGFVYLSLFEPRVYGDAINQSVINESDNLVELIYKYWNYNTYGRYGEGNIMKKKLLKKRLLTLWHKLSSVLLLN